MNDYVRGFAGTLLFIIVLIFFISGLNGCADQLVTLSGAGQ
jgi:hypothetical protein